MVVSVTSFLGLVSMLGSRWRGAFTAWLGSAFEVERMFGGFFFSPPIAILFDDLLGGSAFCD